MSSPRLVPVAALAAAALALPASAAAALTPLTTTPVPDPAYGTHTDAFGNQAPNWTADNILGPGESINVSFPMTDDGQDENSLPLTFDGGTGLLSRTDNSDLSILTTTRLFGASQGGLTSSAVSAGGNGLYQLQTGSNLVCGTSVGLNLAMSSVAQPAFNKNYSYALPTGVRGAFRRTPSINVGQVVNDGGTVQSTVDVSGQDGLSKGLRIHIDSLEHRFSTYWLELVLIAPSGKKVTLMDRQGSLDANTAARPKTLSNITFSDEPVGGEDPKDPSDALTAGYSNIVMQPKQALSTLDGEPLNGTWKLQVHDIAQPLSNRSIRGRGHSFTGNEMAQLGDWQLDTASAVCTGAPQAWFGAPGPLVLSPAGGTLDASASSDPTLGGSIASYNWDLDGNPSTGVGGFEVTTTSPTVPYGAVTAMPYSRDIRLQVVDNAGNASPTVTRTAIFSNKPSIGPVTLTPSTPIAGQQVTLGVNATDADAGDTLTYAWDLNGDGSFTDGTGVAPSYSWPNSGPQTIRLRVTDSRGAASYSWQTISIANTNPVARMTFSPTIAVVGQTVTLDGSTSTDVDGTVAVYSWDLDGNGSIEDLVSQSPTATTSFDSPGEHMVRLQVTDNTGGTDLVEVPVWVTRPPVGVIAATPTSPLIGESVTFSAAQSYDGDPGGSIARYEWDLDGNGSYEVSGATSSSATKSYPNAGGVSVRLRLTDNDGATSVTPFLLTVRSPNTGGSGGTTPTPTPTPTPKPNAGGAGGGGTGGTPVPPVTLPDGGKIVDAVTQDPLDLTTVFTDPDAEPGAAKSLGDFTAAINAGAKAKAAKAYRTGIAISLKATKPGKIAVKAMITAKVAKAVGITTKAKLLSVGSGTLTLTKAGSGKFVVRFNKKYAAKLKRAKSVKVSLRGVVTSSDGVKLTVGRSVTIVK